MDTAERRAVAALWCIPGIGRVALSRIAAALGSPGELLHRPVASWAPRVPLTAPQAEALGRVRVPLAALADALERRVRRGGQRVVFPGDAAWPPGLAAVTQAPPLLFLQGPGAAPPPRRRAAVVGTRRPDPGVLGRVRDLACDLARAGVGVVSGAAIGVDEAAHRGALDGGGETWAFLGEGLDRVSSGARAELVADLLHGGGSLYSQLPPGAPASRATFRLRNPLISGAADAVLVARAPERSGALITARAARAQGRPLLAMPGDPWNPCASGCNALLRQGLAAACHGPDEVLAALGLPPIAPRAAGRVGPVSADAAALLAKARTLRGVDVDLLAAVSGRSPGQVAALLVELQLAGRLVQRGGGRYELLAAPEGTQSNVDDAGTAN